MEIKALPRDGWLFNSPLTQAAGARHTGLCLPGLGCLDSGHLLLSRESDLGQ